MTALWQDLRFAARMLAKSPSFTVVAVATLALGIGANTAMFSVLDTVALRSLPYEDPDPLVLVSVRRVSERWTDTARGVQRFPDRSLTKQEWQNLVQDRQVFEATAGFWSGGGTLTGLGEPLSLHGQIVTVDFFDVLGVKPFAGRTFEPEDAEADAPPVAVVSYAFWQGRLAGDPRVLGRTLTVGGVPHTVVGILPPDFQAPQEWGERSAIWTPLEKDEWYRANQRWVNVLGRLAPGVRPQDAPDAISALSVAVLSPEELERGRYLVAESVHDNLVGGDRANLFVMFAAVAFVLLIACVNLAHLLLARATSRHREMAVRKALGAGRLRLVRQLLVESLLLAGLGGTLGVLLASWLLPPLLALSPMNMPRIDQVSVDGRVLLFSLGLSILTGLAFGLAPAWQIAGQPLRDVLQNVSGLGSGPRGLRRFRSAMVVTEIALSLVLLIGAGLLVRTFLITRPVNLGFNPSHRLTAQVRLPDEEYSQQPQKQIAYFREGLERLGGLPAVEDVAGASFLPLPGMHYIVKFLRPGQQVEESDLRQRAYLWSVSANYFRVMEIPLLAGRPFTETDTETAVQVVIVNETLADMLWPGENPLGRMLTFFPGRDESVTHEVVGVAADSRSRGSDGRTWPTIYRPFTQFPDDHVSYVVKTPGNPNQLAAAVRQELQAIEPDHPVQRVETMESMLWANIFVVRRRFYAWTMGLFAGLALVLVLVGIFGVISHSVGQRTREIGLRIALGAQRGEVLWLVLGQGFRWTLLGLLIGLGASWGLTRLIAHQLSGVTPTDPLTFAVVSATLAAASLLAAYLPARRAAKVDPMTALRYE